MEVSWEQGKQFSSGSSSLFRLQDGESAKVRFLYNTKEDIKVSIVHSIGSGKDYAAVDCSRQPGDSLDTCKWCASGNNPVSRVVIPIFNETDNQIQYWMKSQKWVDSNLIPILNQIPPTQPISGQVCIITRTGSEMKDTKYSVAPQIGAVNDGRQKDSFGEIQNPIEAKIIKENNYEIPVSTPNTNDQAQFQSTRRTTNTF